MQGAGAAPLLGLGATPQLFHGRPVCPTRQQKRRQRSVPASNFALPQERPQAALLTNSTLSRQMGATDQHGRRFSLDAGLFHCRRKTESVSYRNRKAPAAAGQSSLCAAGVVLCCLHLRLLELRIIQFRVEAALLQQLLVRAGFDDVAVAHDQNLVRVLDGGETVRNDERGTSLR